MKIGLGPDHIESDGDPAPPPQRGTDPLLQFSAHVCCGQTAQWIKMLPGSEVNLGPCDIVLDGDTTPPPKAHSPGFLAAHHI